MFNYNDKSNLIANLIKKLFSPVFQEKKKFFIEASMVPTMPLMMNWIDLKVNKRLKKYFKLYDKNKDDNLDLEEFTLLM